MPCTIQVCTNSRRPAFCWKWTQRSVLLLLLHRCKTCSAYTKWSSINYNWGASFTKKTFGRDLTELTSSHSWQPLLVTNHNDQSPAVYSEKKLWLVDVRVVRSPGSHSNSTLTALFTTIKLTCCYEYYVFIRQWDNLLSDISLEC